jgi:transcriptional regulator with XRE-family HTH domain
MSKHFGSYIKSLRNHCNLSGSQLADRIGVSQSYVSLLESGRANPPSNVLLHEIAEALDAPLDDLFVAADRVPPGVNLSIAVKLYREFEACHPNPDSLVEPPRDDLFDIAARNAGYKNLGDFAKRAGSNKSARARLRALVTP